MTEKQNPNVTEKRWWTGTDLETVEQIKRELKHIGQATTTKELAVRLDLERGYICSQCDAAVAHGDLYESWQEMDGFEVRVYGLSQWLNEIPF